MSPDPTFCKGKGWVKLDTIIGLLIIMLCNQLLFRCNQDAQLAQLCNMTQVHACTLRRVGSGNKTKRLKPTSRANLENFNMERD